MAQTPQGSLARLNAQAGFIANWFLGLYVNNVEVPLSAVLADLVEASWTGYAQQLVGSTTSAVLQGNTAVCGTNALANFANTSGAQQSFYGWFLVDATGAILLAGDSLGLTLLPDGSTFTLIPIFAETGQ